MRILFVTTLIILFSIANPSDNGSGSSTDLLCPSTHFGCKNAYRCIEMKYMCNGEDNCGDNSDDDVTACILKGQVSAQLKCTVSEFQCKNGFRCVRDSDLCDGVNDCKDNSDEDPNECIRAGLYDDHVTCADIGFICGGGSGPCISRKLLCNGKNDCGNNTDEDVANCRAEGVVEDELSCADDKFRCKNEFKCISKMFLCDHDNDCFDGSDEDPVECAKVGFVPEGTTCGDLGFECRNTTFGGSFCIGNLFICDGKNNCGDNSDENPAICQHRSDKPTLEILPWYEQPKPNSTAVKLCGNDQFRCKSMCIPKKYLCHPNVDSCNAADSSVCLNRTQSHKCMSLQFKCKNNKCVYMGHVCDGDNDCGDMSDEDPTTCSAIVRTTTTIAARDSQSAPPRKRPLICKRDQFKCLDENKCIPRSYVCDRGEDCADGSDETQAACYKVGVGVTIEPSTPSHADEFKPIVVNAISNRRTFIIGDLDDNLTLVCPLVGVPEPEYTWTFDSKNAKLVHEVNSRKLTFRHTHEKLAGKYVCEARNLHGVNTFEFEVNVQQQDISAELSSTTIAGVALGTVLLLIVLCITVIFAFKYFRVKRRLRNLSPEEAQEFLDGVPMSEVVSHQDGSEMAMYLPFEKRIEPNSLTLARNFVLGKGQFGIVCQGSLYAETVAVKTFKRAMTLDEFRACLVEVKLMSFVGEHPNIIRFIGADVTNIQSREILVVMELSPLGSLEKHLRMMKSPIKTNYVNTATTQYTNVDDKLTIEKLFGFCEQIAFAMEHMESKRVIHGDLAARNVLVFNHGVVKVTDFGFSRQLLENNLYKPRKNCKLAWRWASIELLRQMEFSTESDIWAFGVTVWEIFTFGDVPFALEKLNENFMESLETGLRLKKPEGLSESQYSFVKECWDLNKSARPRFSALKSFFGTEKNSFRLDVDTLEV